METNVQLWQMLLSLMLILIPTIGTLIAVYKKFDNEKKIADAGASDDFMGTALKANQYAREMKSQMDEYRIENITIKKEVEELRESNRLLRLDNQRLQLRVEHLEHVLEIRGIGDMLE